MKSKLFLAVLFLVVLVIGCLSGCKKDLQPKTDQTENVKKTDVQQLPIMAYQPGTGESITYNMNDGSVITLQKVNDQYILGGDMRLSASQLKYIQDNSTTTKQAVHSVIKPNSTFTSNNILLWPNATVYYTVNASSNEANVQAAINYYNANTVVHFVPRTNQANYVEFFTANLPAGVSGISDIGMVGNKQQLLLEPFAPIGTVIHEMGHTLGLMHEQTRADRDSYIIVNFNNIKSDFTSQYQIYSGISGFQIGPFDFESIMMYKSYYSGVAYPGNPALQITKLDGSTYTPLEDQLSAGDKSGIAYLYSNLFIRLRFVNVPVTQVPDVERINQDIYIDFYADAACTTPKTLTQPTQIRYTENLQQWYTTAPQHTNTLTSYQPMVAAGASFYKIHSNFTTSLFDDRSGNRRSYVITDNLVGWIGYVTVSPPIRQ